MNESEKETKEFLDKLDHIKEDWLKANLQRLLISMDSAKMRCNIVASKSAWCVEDLTLYVDDAIVSVLHINTMDMEATVENSDGFRSTGNI